MKCPFCGYVSFDHLVRCKKCGRDLGHERRGRIDPSPDEEKATELALAVAVAGEEAEPPPGVDDEENDGASATPPPVASRVTAFLLDAALLTVTGLLFLAAGEWAAGSDGLLPTSAILVDLLIPYFLILFSLCFGYFTLFHFLTGQTPGQMIGGVQLEGEDGNPPTPAQAFLHSIGGLLSLIALGYGFYLALRDPEGRGWNDRLAGTRLVPTERPGESRRWRDELRRRRPPSPSLPPE